MEDEVAASVEAPTRGTGLLAGPVEPASGLRWRRVFPGEERQLRLLRQWIASLLPECPARDDVASVVTELGSNTIRHTLSGQDGVFIVEITCHEQVIRVAVLDNGGPTEPTVVDDPLGESGRGLQVVRGLSARTGFAGDYRGRLVWAEVAWTGWGAVVPGSSSAGFGAAICQDQADLAAWFAGVPVWFGRSTLLWWALPGRASGSRLVSAPSARELAGQLRRALTPRPAAQRMTAQEPMTTQTGGAASLPAERLPIGIRRVRSPFPWLHASFPVP